HKYIISITYSCLFINIFISYRLFRAWCRFSWCASFSGCCGSCLIPVNRPVICNALLYLPITFAYTPSKLYLIYLFLLVDASNSVAFNAVLKFTIFLSSYSFITVLIFALFASGAFFQV
ncbi:MAG: hypothetical protein ACKPKO_04540, partial [Candidatus Fonsibacter sp.]